MSSSTISRAASELPARELATCDRLSEQHGRLRARGVHQRAGGWVVARPEDVSAALTSPLMSVAVATTTGSSPIRAARTMQARMARFSDGPQHARRRALVEQLLPEATGLDAAARRRAAAAAQDRAGAWNVMPLARAVPVLALADALRIPADRVPQVAELVGRLCDALAPSLHPPASAPDGDEAAHELTALLAPVGPWAHEQTAAVAGLLFQARDATAALIGAALLDSASATDPDPAASVDRALRQHAPVQCTRRTPVEPMPLGGVSVPRGAPVWVVLAAAEPGAPYRPATFGAGQHACPGADHAVALARGVVAGLHATGWQAVPGQPVRYEARPNLRMPAAVLVQRP